MRALERFQRGSRHDLVVEKRSTGVDMKCDQTWVDILDAQVVVLFEYYYVANIDYAVDEDVAVWYEFWCADGAAVCLLVEDDVSNVDDAVVVNVAAVENDDSGFDC